MFVSYFVQLLVFVVAIQSVCSKLNGSSIVYNRTTEWIGEVETLFGDRNETDETSTATPLDEDTVATTTELEIDQQFDFCNKQDDVTGRSLEDFSKNIEPYLKWTKSVNSRTFREIQVENLEKYMDPSQDPCQNFFLYACGNWAESGQQESARAHLLTNLRTLVVHITKSPIDSDDSDSVVKMKTFFTSCMNEEEIETRKMRPFIEFASQLGPWPILNLYTSPEDFNWVRTMAELRTYDIKAFFNTGTEITNSDDPDCTYTLVLRCNWPRPVEEFAKEVDEYVKLLEDNSLYLDLHGLPLNRLGQIASKLIKFHDRLTQLSCRYKNRVQIDLKRLREQIPDFNWQEYFSIILGRPLNPREPILVSNVKYIAQVIAVIKSTDKEVVADYMFLHVLRYYKEFISPSEDGFQLKYCMQWIFSRMEPVIIAHYRKSFSNTYKEREILSIYEDIRRSLVNHLVSPPHAEEDELNGTLKSDVEKFSIGMRSWNYYDERDIKYIYSDINMKPNKFFENIVQLNRHHVRRLFHKVGQHPDPADELCVPQNPEIRIRTQVLQPPVYHEFATRVLNYAGIGKVAAESFLMETRIIHGEDKIMNQLKCSDFDDLLASRSLQIVYDAQKNWTQNFPELTQSEFAGFKRLNLTQDQLFFLAYGQMQCTSKRNLCHGHIPPINTAVSDNKDFAIAFNCPVGTPMNPAIAYSIPNMDSGGFQTNFWKKI